MHIICKSSSYNSYKRDKYKTWSFKEIVIYRKTILLEVTETNQLVEPKKGVYWFSNWKLGGGTSGLNSTGKTLTDSPASLWRLVLFAQTCPIIGS